MSKGMTPRKGYSPKAYRDNYDAIFPRISCDICGRFVSYADLENGRAVRYLDTPDAEGCAETYETYHVACRAKETS